LIDARVQNEVRYALIGKIESKVWTGVVKKVFEKTDKLEVTPLMGNRDIASPIVMDGRIQLPRISQKIILNQIMFNMLPYLITV
jgi:hypothetical protein